MKTMLQLLKEFWLPIIIGLVWTSYNVYGMPQAEWNVAAFINVFAPTFFFTSWLIAQWYRVRKQQRVEESLAGIGARIDATAFPMLPFELFFVSRHTATTESLVAFFSNREGYKSVADNSANLGFTPFDSPVPYNWKDKPARKLYSSIEGEEVPSLVNLTIQAGETPIKLPIRVEVKFYRARSKEPALTLRAQDTLSDGCASFLELLDDMVYQHTRLKEWDVSNPSKKAWSVHDLRGMRVRLHFKYIFFHLINLERPPRIHDLHLCFGRDTTNTLYLTTGQLDSQSLTDDSEDSSYNAINEHSKMKSLILDFQIDDNLYSRQFVQLTGRD